MAEARRYVEEALIMWEPRIQVRGVDVHADPEDESRARLLIEIRYEIKSTHDPRSLVHPFYLIPEE
jgi:phage baseplate assembly protein W